VWVGGAFACLNLSFLPTIRFSHLIARQGRSLSLQTYYRQFRTCSTLLFSPRGSVSNVPRKHLAAYRLIAADGRSCVVLRFGFVIANC
jgi:hypothetical protein